MKLITTLLLALIVSITSSCSKSGADAQGSSKTQALPQGRVTEVLHPNFTPGMSMDIYLDILGKWVSQWGKPEYAL
jgi:hypothetical protein